MEQQFEKSPVYQQETGLEKTGDIIAKKFSWATIIILAPIIILTLIPFGQYAPEGILVFSGAALAVIIAAIILRFTYNIAILSLYSVGSIVFLLYPIWMIFRSRIMPFSVILSESNFLGLLFGLYFLLTCIFLLAAIFFFWSRVNVKLFVSIPVFIVIICIALIVLYRVTEMERLLSSTFYADTDSQVLESIYTRSLEMNNESKFLLQQGLAGNEKTSSNILVNIYNNRKQFPPMDQTYYILHSLVTNKSTPNNILEEISKDMTLSSTTRDSASLRDDASFLLRMKQEGLIK